MTDKELRDLPTNDDFGQWIKKINEQKNMSESRRQQLITQMRNCDHYFVKLREGRTYFEGYDTIDNYNSPDIVECVCCGATNKFEVFENPENHQFLKNENIKRTAESEAIEGYFEEHEIEPYHIQDKEVEFISREPLNTCHPKLLYDIASYLSADGGPDEIFGIMKTLNKIETGLERVKLERFDQADDLICRYMNLDADFDVDGDYKD